VRFVCAIQIDYLYLYIFKFNRLNLVFVALRSILTCSYAEPLCVVMELAANGSLQRMLRRQRRSAASSLDDVDSDSDVTSRQRHVKLTSSDLVLFAVHVATGMEYVASQRVMSCLF